MAFFAAVFPTVSNSHSMGCLLPVSFFSPPANPLLPLINRLLAYQNPSRPQAQPNRSRARTHLQMRARHNRLLHLPSSLLASDRCVVVKRLAWCGPHKRKGDYIMAFNIGFFKTTDTGYTGKIE